ncbi:MAG: Mor transcription activator family protein [Clostridia bacterium]|nr:Mor transcription activator family protein [Clostridia bacterium]
MSVNKKLFDDREMLLLKNDLCSLNEVYRDIADEIGLENALVIYNMFHGTQISFPNRLFSKEHIHEAILNEYNGSNVSQLAQKYNYSERSIRRILKSKK